MAANIFLTGRERQYEINKIVSHQSELYSILYELYKMMHAYALKQTWLLLRCYSTEDRPVRNGGPSAVQARDEFQKHIGSV